MSPTFYATLQRKALERFGARRNYAPVSNERIQRIVMRANALEARAIYRSTRGLNLPRAPLHGGPSHKALSAPLSAFGKRYGQLGFAGMQNELRALLRGEAAPPARKAARTVKNAFTQTPDILFVGVNAAESLSVMERAALAQAARITIGAFLAADHTALRAACEKLGLLL